VMATVAVGISQTVADCDWLLSAWLTTVIVGDCWVVIVLGAVFGTWFTSAGKALGGTEVDGPALAEAMAAAAQAVRNRAKAAPGDKTMIDALLPAVEALRAAAGEGPEGALRQAAAAAAAGVEATRQMIPRLGKARTMGERAVGFIDPGALSVAIIFEGLAATP